MSKAQREQQARAFLEFHRKLGGPAEENWTRWAGSKRFQPADRLAIGRAAMADLFSTGERVATDILNPPTEAA